MRSQYNPPAIQRAFRILDYMAEAQHPLRLTHLAKELGYSKSTLHGLLASLEELQWVRREGPREGYRVGQGLLLLARKAFGFWELPEIARPLMERVAEHVGESVFLGTRQGDQVVIMFCVQGRNEMRVTSPPGTTLPLMAAATGKVFLAAMSPREAEKTLSSISLPRFTERSILSTYQFLREVERARERGYATDDEEYLRGIRAVAAPIQHKERMIAAMWVVGLVSNLTDMVMEKAARELLEATGIVSRLLEPRGPS